MTAHPLATSRLILRPPVAADAEALAAELNDWEVASRLATAPHPYAVDDAREWLANLSREGADDIVFLLAPRDAPRDAPRNAPGGVIGCVGFHKFGEANEPEIGYWLAKRFWGRGLMTEAVGAAVDFLRRRGVRKIRSMHMTDNAASGAVLRKLGFAVTGRCRAFSLALGQDRDMIVTCLSLAEDGDG